MRKIALASLSAILLLTAIPNPSSAAVSGSKCTKVGTTKTVSNIKYTCVKQGSKLVWNKGITIKPVAKPAATPTPTPTPTETSKPEPKPTPSPTATVAAFVPPKAPTSFDDLVENYKGIAYAAWSKAHNKIAASSATSSNIYLQVGANSVIPNPNPKAAYDAITKLYDGGIAPKRIDVIAFGWTDREWAQEKMKAMLPNSTWQWVTMTACATIETCWGGGAFSDGKGNLLLMITTEVKDENHISGTLEAHEFTHIIQQAQMTRPAPWPLTSDWPPTWYFEGQAEFSQNAAIFTNSYDEYLKNRRQVSENLFRNQNYDSAFFEKYFVINPPSDWFQIHDRWLQYDAGGMLIEILTALKGPDSTMEMWRQMNTGLTFREAFKKIYEVDFDKVLPTISKAIALEVGKS
jgi:hypothetical protein